ncbi:MAG: family 10 glycosylhydrolase [Alphaproteobacteria bacterium]|nr:family 10 glycosylhydrolase [Alphaproteobacteria bacterium]MCB9792351.1 family 10 glycosylhydrolase [Alphaproteobacteria bacterium]
MPLLLLLACAGDLRWRPLPEGDTPGEVADDTGALDSEPSAETVAVSHSRELRGVWVATVWNINFPDSSGASAQSAELVEMTELLASLGFNTIIFQVRPEGDALYDSTLEPWSRSLTGTQGVDPGYDPLAVLLEAAHARGIEVHAWLNPYRGAASSGNALAAGHLCVEQPSVCHTYSSYLWMDPGEPAVRARTVAVVRDLVTRYDLDGIHFDDYFYPYPDGTDFPDGASYAAYGGGQSRDDWRRDNVHALVRDIAELIAAEAPHVRFGIAPFGIYRSGTPSGTWGLDQYASLYSDPLVWLQEGWLDHIAPQLYWTSDSSGQAYDLLADWWSEQAEPTAWTFPGHALYQLGSSSSWDVAEIRTQVELTRRYQGRGATGDMWYHIGPLQTNLAGISDVFRDELHATPAWPPPTRALMADTLPAPRLSVDGGRVSPSHGQPVRAWGVYQERDGAWEIARIVPGTEASIELSAGRWAISAIGLGGVESAGVLVEL